MFAPGIQESSEHWNLTLYNTWVRRVVLRQCCSPMPGKAMLYFNTWIVEGIEMIERAAAGGHHSLALARLHGNRALLRRYVCPSSSFWEEFRLQVVVDAKTDSYTEVRH